MKRRIRLTEGDLRRIVNRSVRRVLREDMAPSQYDDANQTNGTNSAQTLSQCRKVLTSANYKVKQLMALARGNNNIIELAKQIEKDISDVYTELYDNFSTGTEYWQA